MSIKTLVPFFPNVITLSRLILTPMVFVLHYLDRYSYAAYVFWLFVVLGITDFFDGYLARKLSAVSDLGRCFDIIADKALVASMILILVDLRAIPFLFANLIFFREFWIAGIREYASWRGIVVPASSFGKLKTTTQMVGLPMLYLVATKKSVGSSAIYRELVSLFGGVQSFHSVAIYVVSASVLLSYVSVFDYARSLFISPETSGALPK